MRPFRIFIGFDPRETVAYHVLAHSIQARVSKPVALIPIDLRHLGGIYTRPLAQQSTAFTYSRFLVPWLCGFEGLALFLDCDMLVRADLMGLWAAGTGEAAVWVCQHDYTPRAGAKFLGEPQIAYPRKNWSSLMLFNNAKCRALTPQYVNTASPADLHRFAWLDDHQIGSLPLEWNHLVGEENQVRPPKIIHFTRGGPWIKGCEGVEYAEEWGVELSDMLGQAPTFGGRTAPTRLGCPA